MTVSITEVRILIGDTDTSDELFNDLQLGVLIDIYGDLFSTAAAACQALAAKFARQVDASVDSVKASNSQKYEHYKELAKELTNQARASGRLSGLPFAGGISVADKTAREGDEDRVAPAFTRSLFDGTD